MRTCLLLVAVAVSCADAPARPLRQVARETAVKLPAETAVEPRRVVIGDQREAFNAAMRALAAVGYRISFADAGAGVLTAEKEDVDEARTALLAQERGDLWERLTPDQKALAYRTGQSLQIQALVIIRRRVTISVVVGPGLAILTPKTQTCSEAQNEPQRCGSFNTMLRGDEVAAVLFAETGMEISDLPDK